MASPNSSTPSSKRTSFSSMDGSQVQLPNLNRMGTDASTTSTSSQTSTSSASSATGDVLVDVLSRQFPKPTQDINVAEMLARAPQRHSLRYYVRNARDIESNAETKEQQARKFADTKKMLLESSLGLNQLPPPKR